MNAAVVVATLAISAVCRAATLQVPGDYPTIQACIDATVSSVDECVVAPGTYNETINFLGKAITVRSSGGADVTTIDATGIGGSVVKCSTGEGPDTVLDSFTITGGTGSDPYGNGYTYGGGMYNFGSAPTVTNCTFRGNTPDIGGGLANHDSAPRVTNCLFRDNRAISGGGMVNANSTPIVSECTFFGNAATYGGGMSNFDADPTVKDCTFSANMARTGGGMFNQRVAPTVTRCSFNGNAATVGGGMYNEYGDPKVTNCSFSGNTATQDGGGMDNYYSSPTVTNCTFSENTADFGGGMLNDSSSPTVTNCTFSGNTAFSGGGMGNNRSNPTVTNCAISVNTATYYGGGMYNQSSSPTVTNCTFNGNTADYGGGMVNLSGSPTVTNCTFSGNTADYGGGMRNWVSHVTVTNCILWRDTPDEIPSLGELIINFSDVQGGLPAGAVDGGDNIYVDPMFVRPPDPGPDGMWDGVDDDYGDLRLRAGSPCIDKGDPLFVALPGETDLDGHARVLCEHVDMGAYEFGIGDHDCNDVVNLVDVGAWDVCQTGPVDPPSSPLVKGGGSGCEAFDFDGDGDVDLRDFAGFQRVFAGR